MTNEEKPYRWQNFGQALRALLLIEAGIESDSRLTFMRRGWQGLPLRVRDRLLAIDWDQPIARLSGAAKSDNTPTNA